ncbi:MAG: hypothetical protein ACP5OG_04895 [Candidatus Nanoarchaeia archaeon]
MANLEEGQIVLCTVDKIIGTTVFVKIQDGGDGTITTSEIAPGRIRNLRDYVVPGKRIVCKVLKFNPANTQLSLRRVKLNERKDFLEKVEKEKNYSAIIRTVSGENAQNIIHEINKEHTITDFLEEAKNSPATLEKYFTKEQAEKIIKILESKKEKLKQIKETILLSSKESEGVNRVKDTISEACKDSLCDVSYLSAGKYSIAISGSDLKKIGSEINRVLDIMEKSAKKNKCDFSVVKN